MACALKNRRGRNFLTSRSPARQFPVVAKILHQHVQDNIVYPDAFKNRDLSEQHPGENGDE